MIIYKENPKESHKKNKSTGIIKNNNRVARYNINVQNQLLSYNKWNENHNTIYISTLKNDILRHKSNKIGARSV